MHHFTGTVSPTKSMSSSLATLREGTGELGASSTVLAGPHQSQATLPDVPHPTTTTTTGHHTLSLPLHLSSRELGEAMYYFDSHDRVRFLCVVEVRVIITFMFFCYCVFCKAVVIVALFIILC